MSALENEFALVDFLESARAEGVIGVDDAEANWALYEARERIAKHTGQAALFEVKIER